MDKMDYTIAFEELNTLNRAFFKREAYTLPTLNPLRFDLKDSSETQIIVQGRLSGEHFLIGRSEHRYPNGNRYWQYTGAVHAQPVNRTIIEWETV